jgi:hypothetical protein
MWLALITMVGVANANNSLLVGADGAGFRCALSVAHSGN